MSPYDPKNPPRALILPENQPLDDRNAFIEALCEEHADFILGVLLRRRDLQEASARDVRQQVMVVFCEHLDEHPEKAAMSPEEMQAFLRGVIRMVTANYTRARRRALPLGPETDGVLCPALDPERAAALAEHRAKIARYLDELTFIEAAVVRAIDLEGKTVVEVAEKLGRRRGTVSTIHGRAREKLRERALASERATALKGRAARRGGTPP